MPQPIRFPGVNVVIAENQTPYIPLPAMFMGDNMGTVLTCWEFTEEEMEEFMRTRKLWISHWTFNQPFQPLCPSTDQPVAVNPESPTDEKLLKLFDCPAEWMPNEEQIKIVTCPRCHGQGGECPNCCNGSIAEMPKGYIEPGWYFWNLAHDEVYGPHPSRVVCEAMMRKYAADSGNPFITGDSSCECEKAHGVEPRTRYLEHSIAPGFTKPGWYHCGNFDGSSGLKIPEVFGPFKNQATAIAALLNFAVKK